MQLQWAVQQGPARRILHPTKTRTAAKGSVHAVAIGQRRAAQPPLSPIAPTAPLPGLVGSVRPIGNGYSTAPTPAQHGPRTRLRAASDAYAAGRARPPRQQAKEKPAPALPLACLNHLIQGTKPALQFELVENGAKVTQTRPKRKQSEAERAAGQANFAPQQERGGKKGKGLPSLDVERGIRRAIGSLLALSRTPEAKQWRRNEALGYRQQRCYLSFITPTLPAPQHRNADGSFNDEEFWEMLSVLLKWLCRTCGVEEYVAVPEPAGNGNAHAHILSDKFVENVTEAYLKAGLSPLLITKKWNAILKKYGYIDEYAAIQRAKYANGFFFDSTQLETRKKWSGAVSGWEEVAEVVPNAVQRRRWEEGEASGWTQPNTVDAHSLYKAENAAGYLASYMCKGGWVRPMSGRLWSKSRGLGEVKPFKPGFDDEIRASVQKLEAAGEVKTMLVTSAGYVTQQEYDDSDMRAAGVLVWATVYSWKAADFWRVAPPGFVRAYQLHWREQFRLVYG